MQDTHTDFGARERRLIFMSPGGETPEPAPAPPKIEQPAEQPATTTETTKEAAVNRSTIAGNQAAAEMQKLYDARTLANARALGGDTAAKVLGGVEGMLTRTSMAAHEARIKAKEGSKDQRVMDAVRDATGSAANTVGGWRQGAATFGKQGTVEYQKAQGQIDATKALIAANEGGTAEALGKEIVKKNDTVDTAEKNERYDRVKGEQLLKREQAKHTEAGDRWSTIDNGKTDNAGNQFLYKKVNGVLLAYAPVGGLQAMDAKGQWRHIDENRGNEEDKALARTHADIHGEYEDLKNTGIPLEEQRKERQRQNSRNRDMEENCLKSKDAGSDWYTENYHSFRGWDGNEDVRAALEAAIEGEGADDAGKTKRIDDVVPPKTPTAPEMPKAPATAVQAPTTTAGKPKETVPPLTKEEERIETLLDTQKIITERIERAQLQLRGVEKDIKEISSFNLLRSGERSAKEAELRQLGWKIEELRHYHSLISTPGCPLVAIQHWREKLGLSRVPQSVADRKNISHDDMETQRKEAQRLKSRTVEVDYNAINRILKDADVTLEFLEHGIQILDQGMQVGTMFIPYGNEVYNLTKGATNVASGQRQLGEALTETAFNILLAKTGGKVVQKGGEVLVEVGGKLLTKSGMLAQIAEKTGLWVSKHTPDIAKRIAGNSAQGGAIGGVVGGAGTAIGNVDEWGKGEKTAAEIAKESWRAAKSGAAAGAVFGAVGGEANRKAQTFPKKEQPKGSASDEKPRQKSEVVQSSETHPSTQKNVAPQNAPVVASRWKKGESIQAAKDIFDVYGKPLQERTDYTVINQSIK